MKKIFLASLIVSLFGLGCYQRVELQNGELPDAFIPAAQALVGHYTGTFDHQPVDLTFKLEGKRLVVESARDVLYGNCGARIGELKSLSSRSKNSAAVGMLAFDFDAGKCHSVWGNAFLVEVPKNAKKGLALSVYDHTETIDYGHGDSEDVDYYIQGRVKKVD